MFILLASTLLHPVFAQEYVEATPAQRRQMQEQIAEATSRLSSLACDFEQTKEIAIMNEKMQSSGRMFYRRENCVRWEYTTPYAYTFIYNNNRIAMQTEAGRSVIDVRSNALFQSIVKIMISSMNGSGMTDNKSFTPRFYIDGSGRRMVSLTPVQKDVRKMFALIRLYFDGKDHSVETVVMEEPNGDATHIRLTNKRINEKIDDSRFTVD
jgi:outer membrane lipoprotein carrier protein